MDSSSSGANNSSDFVRKLYKMLESPQDESVVRWGNEGDSFVVLEVRFLIQCIAGRDAN